MQQFRLSFLCLVILAFSQSLFSQAHIYTFNNKIPVSVNGQNLKNAWAGGFNSAQINKMDLDNDGIEDLVLFDKTASKIATFLYKNNGFVYDAKYELRFPKIQSWMQLIDYDGDGKKDIFTTGDYSSTIGVYRNTSTNKKISWEQVSTELLSSFTGLNFLVSIYNNPSDFPSISDIDNDGDLDIITYSDNGTNSFQSFINQSKEIYNDCSHLVFDKFSSCYGKFSAGNQCNTPVNINQSCPAYLGGSQDNARVLHSMVASVKVYDLNGDGLKDILLGDGFCNNIQALYNSGTNIDAKITTIVSSFPPQYPINIEHFPAVFIENIDEDTLKDLLASPITNENDGYAVDLVNSLWMYKNIGTNKQPNFSFTGKNFLQNEMIDLGESASPAIFDYDLDGDLDLFVGNKGFFTAGTTAGSIYLYKNIGTKDSAQFSLEDEDYLSLSGLNFSDIRIGFAPVDDNNSTDLYFMATNTDEVGLLYFIPNANDSGFAPNFNIQNLKTINIDAYYSYPNDKVSLYFRRFSKSDYIHIFRYQSELKLLFGTNAGNLQLYSNNFSNGLPNFTFEKDNFLNTTSNDYTRYAVKAVTKIRGTDSLVVFTTNSLGEINIYTLPSLYSTTFTATNFILLNPDTNTVQPTSLGSNAMIGIANLRNNDTIPDLIIGTKGGGLLYLKNEFLKTMLPPTTISGPTTSIPGTSVGTNISNAKKPFKIYPNPVESILYIEAEQNCNLRILDFLGRQIGEMGTVNQGSVHLEDVSKLNSGIYFIKIETRGINYFEKIIVKPSQ